MVSTLLKSYMNVTFVATNMTTDKRALNGYWEKVDWNITSKKPPFNARANAVSDCLECGCNCIGL